MSLPTKHLFIGLFLGAVSAGILSAVGPGMAVDLIPDHAENRLDSDNLVRFRDRTYEVTYSEAVSTEPISQASLRKISYGRVSHVDITTTATGTYSSEALFSPHVRYPGVEVQRVYTDEDRHQASYVSVRSPGKFTVTRNSAGSFTYLYQPGQAFTMRDGTACIRTVTFRTCN